MQMIFILFLRQDDDVKSPSNDQELKPALLPISDVARSSGVKRTAAAAFTPALVAVLPLQVSPNNNPDHNYHVLVDQRQRLNSEALTDDQSTDDIGTMPGDTKRQKYLERRKKNNLASKRSRETRKNMFADMETQAEQLEKSNDDLRRRIVELERLTQQMKAVLVERLSAAN